MKNEKKANNSFFYFYFFIQENFYFLRKHIWKNLIYIVTFALSLFHVAGYCKCSNTNVHIYIHQFCRRHTLIQNTWQQTRYFYVDFDSNGVFLLFIYFGQVPSIQGKKGILIWTINFIIKSIRKGIEILVKRLFSFSIKVLT